MSSNESQSIEQQANVSIGKIAATVTFLPRSYLITADDKAIEYSASKQVIELILHDSRVIRNLLRWRKCQNRDKKLSEYDKNRDMSDKSALSLSVPEIGENSRDHKYRHSLQPKASPVGTPLRHTKSQNYGAKKKKVSTKAPPPAIPELDSPEEDAVKIAIEHVKVGKTERKHSKQNAKGSRKTSQASSRIGFDNAAFEPDREGVKFSRNNSAANSIRSFRSSNRDPSVQSLSVVREQYCCCSRWTPCERALFAAVGVLIFIIILLVIAVILVSVHDGSTDNIKSSLKKLLNG